MRKATLSEISELTKLTADKKDSIKVPEKFEIFVKQDPEELRLERIAELEAELSTLKEPTDKELIAEAKGFNYWHYLNDQLKGIK